MRFPRQIGSFLDVIFQPQCLTHMGRAVVMSWKHLLLSLEGLYLWLFRRDRRWRRKNGRRWVLDS